MVIGTALSLRWLISRACSGKIRHTFMKSLSAHNVTCGEAEFSDMLYWTDKCRFNQDIFPNYNEQDATFLDLFINFYRCSTSFRRFLRPSSGAQDCTYSFRDCQPILLLAAIVDEMESSSISSTTVATSSNG